MKVFKIHNLTILLLLFCSVQFNILAQSGIAQKWQTTGNYGVGQTAYIGTADTTHLSFGVNGSEKMRLNNAGFFGVGSRNPLRPLVVQYSHPASLTGVAIYNTDTTPLNHSILSFRFNTTQSSAKSFIEFGSVDAVALSHVNNNSAGALTFGVRKRNSNALPEAMRIDSSTNVGIGTIHPLQKLQVHGIIYSDSGGIKFPDGNLQNSAGWLLNGNNISGYSGYIGTLNNKFLQIKQNNFNCITFDTIGEVVFNDTNSTRAVVFNPLAVFNNQVSFSGDEPAIRTDFGNLIYGNRSNNVLNVGIDLSPTPSPFNPQPSNTINIGDYPYAYQSSSQSIIISNALQPVGGTPLILDNSIMIGNNISTPINVYNSIGLGASCEINNSNQVRIGNSETTDIGGYSNWNNISDKRLKNVTTDTVVGLPFVMALKPVQYYWKRDSCHSLLHTGLLAQDVDSLAESMNFDFDGVVKPKVRDDITKGQYGISYSQIVMPLIVAIQQQQKEIEELKKEVQILINNK